MSGGGSKPGQRRGGRQKGTPNKVTRDLRDIARRYTEEAIARAVQLMRSKDRAIALRAVEVLLDRGYGKPTSFREVKRSPLDDLTPEQLGVIAAAIEASGVGPAGSIARDQTPAVDGEAGGVQTLQ